MADILNIGLSALQAQQRALTTTSNNIANAATPGYSRQRVEFAEREAQRLGPQFIGSGVQGANTRRLGDEILANQVRAAASTFQRAEAFVSLASSLDDLIANTDTGLSATMQSFVNSLQDVANDPSSTASRQSLLSEARNLVAGFEAMAQQLTTLADEARSRMAATTAEINSIGADLAEVNRRMIALGTAQGVTAPPDLLDRRDQLLEQLAEHVQVNAVTQNDGTTSVFIGTGQVLVIGTDAAELAVIPGAADPEQSQIVVRGIGPDVNVTSFLTGGQLGGVLDFNRELLMPARAELGRIAVGLASTVNEIHRRGIDAEGDLGGDFFAVDPPQTYGFVGNTSATTVAVTITDIVDIEPTNYHLTFDGTNYTLLRTDSGAVVPMTGAGTVASPFVADGLSFVVSGTPAANDQFLLKPLENVGGTLRLLVDRPTDIAAAAATRTRTVLANIGNAAISPGQVIDGAHPSLLTTATIEFLTPTTYSINGAGSFAYTPGGDIDINGTRVQITGEPLAGDRFTIESNAGGTGDNRNMQALIAGLGANIFDGEISLQDAAAGLLTQVGARTSEASGQRDMQKFVLEQSKERLESVRGVNLDEEAANMLRYEQLYHAAAQVMAVAGNLFNTLLNTLGR